MRSSRSLGAYSTCTYEIIKARIKSFPWAYQELFAMSLAARSLPPTLHERVFIQTAQIALATYSSGRSSP